MALKKKHISLSNKKLTIGITIGDPSGIGPEVVVKALNSRQVKRLANFLVIGDSFVLSKSVKVKLNKILNADLRKSNADKRGYLRGDNLRYSAYNLRESALRNIFSSTKNIKILDLANVNRRNFSFGKLKPEYGWASMKYLNFALNLFKKGIIDGLVTAPINKESVNLAGYKITGHTEYLAKKTGTKKFEMMLLAHNLRTIIVTRHIALKNVSKNLKPKNIYQAILLTYDALKKYFLIKRPRIAVSALNPHLGEDTLLGSEEVDKIIPAIKRAKKKYSTIFGPVASDIVFRDCIKGKYDAVVAMYHDQALIPLKTIFSNQAVNLTIGLPFVRTSPCHGTAFDIAGKDIADPTSMIEAIKLAYKLTRNLQR